MEKRSISSLSPNSLSIKRYEVHMIRHTKLRYYDGRPKIPISQLNLSFFCLIFCTRDSHRSCRHSTWGSIFFRLFFPVIFCQNADVVFLETAIILPVFSKTKWSPRQSLRYAHRKLYTKFQFEIRKTELGKRRRVPPRDYSWTSS